MREYELEVLEQYDIDVISTRKTRGAYFCDTKEGLMLLGPAGISVGRAPLMYVLLCYLESRHGMKVDTPIFTKAGKLFVVTIDLSEVRPTVAFPHLPGNAKTIDEIEAMEPIKIDQVVIGSCTNGRMEDMRKAAAILKGHTVHPDVRVMVIPATQKIYKQCIKEGLLDIFVDAGCAVNTPSCGPCMGGHMGVMAAGERCVSTTNRNFVGRMGHVDSLIYLASPEVAAASAIAGYIANPERAGEEA